jgi:hypothetical protein
MNTYEKAKYDNLLPLRRHMFVGYKLDNRLYGCKNPISNEEDENLVLHVMKEYFLNNESAKIKELFHQIIWKKYENIGNENNASLFLAFLMEGSLEKYAIYHKILDKQLNGKYTYPDTYHPRHFKEENGQIYVTFKDYGESLQAFNFEKAFIIDLDKDVFFLEDKKNGEKLKLINRVW